MNLAVERGVITICEEQEMLEYVSTSPLILEMARFAGFMYDEEKGIFYTRKDAFQHYFGFDIGVDYSEYLLGMNLNSLRIIFKDSDQNEWMIEAWNGQYGMGISTGGEMGLYKYTGKYFFSDEIITWLDIIGIDANELGRDYKHYESAGEEWINMSFELYDMESNLPILSRSSDDYVDYYEPVYGDSVNRDWWLTGFKVGEYHDQDNIGMRMTISLTDEQAKRMGLGLQEELSNLESDNLISWESKSKNVFIIDWPPR